MAYPVSSLPDGRVQWSDGSVTGAMSTPQGQVSTQPGELTYQQPSGQVQGLSTTDTQSPATEVTGDTGGDTGGGGDTGPSEYDLWAEQTRGEISSGWDSYIGELDALLGTGLTGQREAQEGIAGSQLESGQAILGAQKEEGTGLLEGQRAKTQKSTGKTLRDLSSNLRNMFMAGNVFLGARGAGDSSAAGQYAHALTKLGSRARSDVMSQSADIMKEIDAREFKLGNIFNTETLKLKSEYDQKIGQISTWFYEAQDQLRLSKGEALRDKGLDLASISQTLLQNALGALNLAKEQAVTKQSALEQWAMNNSETIQELKSNMASVSDVNFAQPQAGQIAGMPSMSGGNITGVVPSGYTGAREDEQKSLFSSPWTMSA